MSAEEASQTAKEPPMRRTLAFITLLLIATSAFAATAEDYFTSGMAKKAKGDLDGAITDYDKAIALIPDNASAYIIRGAAKKAKGDIDGAITDYDKAIALKPDDASA